ncbi:hypothetical protein R83H12_03143 [Fibrobacteria bacterium R8-3-H12]
MRNNLYKIQAAGFALAMAFTYGCGGSKAPPRDTSDVMSLECQEKYKDDFCGVGMGVADAPDAAEELAEADARGKLATKIGVEISRDFERDRVVDLNKKSNQVAYFILEEHIKSQRISNTVLRDARTEFDEKKGLYTKYRSISANKKEVFQNLANDISTQQILQDTDDAIEFSQKVRDYFGKK